MTTDSRTTRQRDSTKARVAECVLLATDGSAESDAALRFASAYAVREELVLRVVTVLAPLPMLPAQPAGVTYEMTIERERGAAILERVRAQLASFAVEPTTLTSVLVGSSGATIADAAGECNARHIIVGAGRHGTLQRLLSGDTVARIMRRTAVPVIAVPATCVDLPHIGVVGFDFGRLSLTAARRAAKLIGKGLIYVVHVGPDIDVHTGGPGPWGEVYEQGAEALMRKITSELEGEFPDVRFETAFERGHPATVLITYAQWVRADLIVVGQHGHGAVDRFLFGSVAQEVVRSAPCTVLVNPPVRRAKRRDELRKSGARVTERRRR